MSPGIGMMKRRLEKERDAVSLAVSEVCKRYGVEPGAVETLETKYHAEAGDWYVALGWPQKRAVVKMDSVTAAVSDISEL